MGVGGGGGGSPGVAVGAARIPWASGGTVGSPGPGGVTVGKSDQAMVGGSVGTGGVGDRVVEGGGAEGRGRRKTAAKRARTSKAPETINQRLRFILDTPGATSTFPGDIVSLL